MKKNTIEYKRWKKRQNEKITKKRSKAKAKKKRRNYRVNTIKKRRVQKQNSRKRIVRRFTAPDNFCIIDNPEETISFFNQIIDFITEASNYGSKLYIDISKVSKLGTDALMYILAILESISEKYKGKYIFAGNVPENKDMYDLFIESGFYKYVRYYGKLQQIKRNDTISISSGTDCDNYLASKIVGFVIDKAKIEKRYCKFLYVMMMELMSNTLKHAYVKDDIFMPHWYCFVKQDSDNTIDITFMDTGSGIPSTVHKRITERMDIFQWKEQFKYVVSALDGELRTSTGKLYRGKGLPKIRGICSSGIIQDMHIVTDMADVKVKTMDYDGQDLKQGLKGTLYNWKININEIRRAAYGC